MIKGSNMWAYKNMNTNIATLLASVAPALTDVGNHDDGTFGHMI
jgi:hypothetical protein